MVDKRVKKLLDYQNELEREREIEDLIDYFDYEDVIL